MMKAQYDNRMRELRIVSTNEREAGEVDEISEIMRLGHVAHLKTNPDVTLAELAGDIKAKRGKSLSFVVADQPSRCAICSILRDMIATADHDSVSYLRMEENPNTLVFTFVPAPKP